MEGHVVNGNAKKTSGRQITKCLAVSLSFIYCNGELLKVFKEMYRTDWYNRVMTCTTPRASSIT